VILVPREEVHLRNRLEDAAERNDHIAVIEEAERFDEEYRGGFFAAYALFQRGYAEYQLKRYAAAVETFERFLNRYPLHPSVPGAREWLRKAEMKIAEKARGRRRCVVPNVRNRLLATARRILSSRRCSLGRIKRRYSVRIKRGRIVSQARRPGSRLRTGARVNVVVSRGRRA